MNEPHTIPVDPSCGSDSKSLWKDPEQLWFMNLYRIYHQILADDEIEALGLVEVDRASYEQVAGITGMSRGQVQWLVFSARRKLLSGMGRTLSELARSSVG